MAVFRCPECAYTFDENKGDDYEGYAAGTLFTELPDDFVCPDCSVRAKEDFEQLTA
ncbi:MAG: rubredoxin [Pseudomonadota bacterium]